MVLICIGALAFLGVTWLDIKNSDVTDTNTGYNSQLLTVGNKQMGLGAL